MIDPARWRPATVLSRERAADDMVAIHVRPDDWLPHRAGQHYEVRFPNGELSRKFSIVSTPSSSPVVELGVQILPTGLVSPRLARVAEGDRLEIRGPLGRAFVWSPKAGESLLLVGAGAGITPLLSMWSQFHEDGRGGACRFVLSAKKPGRVYRYERYGELLDFRFTETGPRLSAADLEAILSQMPRGDLSVRICGPTRFINTIVDAIVAIGVDENRIRSEGFA